MKKLAVALCCTLLATASNAQLMVAKMIGKGAENYGLGYGIFSFIDFPLANPNQSVRLELFDFAMFTPKGENFFSSSTAKGYASIKLGYRYTLSESQYGFYVLPSAGYCYLFDIDDYGDNNGGSGFAGAFESGYSLEVGQRGNSITAGLKYEYDYKNSTRNIQSIGLRLAYSFGLFRKREY